MAQMSRRRFFLHSAHTTIGVSAGFAALEASELLVRPAAAEEKGKLDKPIRLCLVSGSLEYDSDQSLAAFQEYLEKSRAVKCSRAFMRNEKDLPGLENLDESDCMLVFTRRLTLPAEQLDRVKRYCDRGGAIVGVRTASHAFQNWLAFDKEVLGGDYKNHYGKTDKVKVEIAPAAKGDPVLAGVRPFASSGSLYKNPKIAADAKLLLTGTIPEHTEPIAWTRTHRGGRVFYTSLGDQGDFRNETFLRLLTNAIFWTTRRETA
jgi:type 1 glutamine amidotransferase